MLTTALGHQQTSSIGSLEVSKKPELAHKIEVEYCISALENLNLNLSTPDASLDGNDHLCH